MLSIKIKNNIKKIKTKNIENMCTYRKEVKDERNK